jgi:hypothetical protein
MGQKGERGTAKTGARGDPACTRRPSPRLASPRLAAWPRCPLLRRSNHVSRRTVGRSATSRQGPMSSVATTRSAAASRDRTRASSSAGGLMLLMLLCVCGCMACATTHKACAGAFGRRASTSPGTPTHERRRPDGAAAQVPRAVPRRALSLQQRPHGPRPSGARSRARGSTRSTSSGRWRRSSSKSTAAGHRCRCT